MKYLNITLIFTLSFLVSEVYAQPDDKTKDAAFVFTENGNGDAFNGQIYRSSASQRARNGNGNDSTGEDNYRFGNIAHWSICMTTSDWSAQQVAEARGGFKDNQHPLYSGDDVLTQLHGGMGAVGWGSFTANAYNRAAGTGSVAMGYNNIAGTPEGKGAFSEDPANNSGQTVFGFASRATGNVSFASGFRNTAAGAGSVAMGNFNYATGDASIAIGKESYSQGASAVAIGFKSHAAGGGSTALGQENISWGTTNFTAGYQNTAGDTTAAVGTAGSAIAMGYKNIASGRSSAAFNRGTKSINQASSSMGLGTTSDNFGMLAIGVNNAGGIGDLNIDPEGYQGYYFLDGQFTGSQAGVAFVIGNGDIDSSNGGAGANPSNAFMVKYDGSATLGGDLTIESDARLKSNIYSLRGALGKLIQIDGKRYTLKSDEKEHKIGLLAQEIIEVFPELVKEGNDKNGTMSVNYQGLIPVLINAIKEQQNQIDELMIKIELKRKSENETE